MTITAVNDTKVEGDHTGTVGHSVASLDTDYNGISVAAAVVQIRDNDFSITDFATQFRVAGRKRTISSVVLVTTGVVDPALVNLQNFRMSQPNARGVGKPITLRSVAFDPITETATLTPVKDLSLNKTYLLTVSNLGDAGGATLSQPFIINVGTTLSLIDRDGDNGTLSLGGTAGFGYFKTLGHRDMPAVSDMQFRTTISGTGTGIVPSGTAKRGRNGNGVITLPDSKSLGVAPGTTFVSTLTNPPVRIGPLPQSVIDELLAASGGTLAGVLIAV